MFFSRRLAPCYRSKPPSLPVLLLCHMALRYIDKKDTCMHSIDLPRVARKNSKTYNHCCITCYPASAVFPMMASARAKNLATAQDVAKVMRAELVKGLVHEKFMVIDEEKVCDHYAPFICSLLDLTPRPTAKLLEQGAALAFQATQAVAKAFGKRIASCVAYCRLESFRRGKGCCEEAEDFGNGPC